MNILRDETTSGFCRFAAMLLVVSSVTNVKVTAQTNGSSSEKPAAEKPSAEKSTTAANGSCPAERVKDWAGICFKESEAKACPTCAPGSAASAELSLFVCQRILL